MATINNIPIFVKTESYTNETEIPQHPTESGYPITDSIKNKPIGLSLSGAIVNAGSLSADDIITKIEALRTKGSLITYSGRQSAGNFLISDFNYDYTNEYWGGATFSMELKEVRIAKSSYNPKKGTSKPKNGGTQQVQKPKKKAVYYTVKKGDTVWGLVNGPYKSMGKSCDWVIENNPKCFSRKTSNGKGDPRTLQIGAKLLVGYE